MPRQTQEGPYYVPHILRSMIEICAIMGVGEETVKRWVDDGAPIAVEKNGARIRYSCEAAALQAWRKTQANG